MQLLSLFLELTLHTGSALAAPFGLLPLFFYVVDHLKKKREENLSGAKLSPFFSLYNIERPVFLQLIYNIEITKKRKESRIKENRRFVDKN